MNGFSCLFYTVQWVLIFGVICECLVLVGIFDVRFFPISLRVLTSWSATFNLNKEQ